MNDKTAGALICRDFDVQAKQFYQSTGTNHHVTFAAASLFHATGDARYGSDALTWAIKPDADSMFGAQKSYSDWPSWDNLWYSAATLMLDKDMDNASELGFKAQLRRMLTNWVDGVGDIKISPKGQRHISQWGSNRYAANAAGIALLAADHLDDFGQTAKCFAVSQLHYLWGDSGRSFVVGFGNNSPKNPHHRNAACKLSDALSCTSLWGAARPNANVIHGALVGGPPSADDAFDDNRSDYIATEVATDYNSLYTIATAGAMALGSEFWDAFPGNCQGLVPGISW